MLYFATIVFQLGNAGMPWLRRSTGPTVVFYASIYLTPARLALPTQVVAQYAGKPKDKGTCLGIWPCSNPDGHVIPPGLC